MAHDGADMPTTIILDDLMGLAEASLPELETLVSDATSSLRAATEKDGRISGAALGRTNIAPTVLPG